MSDIIILGQAPQDTPSVYETRGLLVIGGADDAGWEPCRAPASHAAPPATRPAFSGGLRRGAHPASGPTLPTAQHVAQALRGVPRETVERMLQQVGWRQR